MTRQAQKLQSQLPAIPGWDWDSKANDLIETTITPDSFIDDEGFLHISGETGQGLVDYYGEFRGGFPYIHEDLEKWAKDRGKFWEWDNPGSICLCD
jgi:hypothetical protein